MPHGRDVSIEGMPPALLLAMRKPLPDRTEVAFLVKACGDITSTDYLPLDTPCEVIG